jgi:hypothetical protein
LVVVIFGVEGVSLHKLWEREVGEFAGHDGRWKLV